MPTLPPATSRTLRGITDLTLAAPLKRGLVAAPDARGHETRLVTLLRSLNTLRYASLEIDPAPAIPDMIDRIRALQSFRLALVDGPEGSRQLLLAVSFDGGWEPYMRRVWRDLGPLLDVIFCNCEGYLLARTHSYAEYARWVRSAQRNTEFFYTASPVTVNDLHWLREQQRAPAPPQSPASHDALATQALPGLTALYRLTELYPPGTADGDCLLHAAHHLLLPLWDLMSATPPALLPSAIPCRTPTEEAAVAWFMTKVQAPPAAPAGACPAHAHWPPADAQAGIVKALPATPTHGALLLIECEDAQAVAHLVRQLDPATLGARAAQAHAGPWRNLFFTLAGLRKAGVPDGLLACLPAEFLEGMEARAAVLGDLEADHPQHWALPERNWPFGSTQATPARVALSSVHAVVQILVADTTAAPGWKPLDSAHPAHAHILAFAGGLSRGARILSVEPLHRNIDAHGQAREHFGFADGLSNPVDPRDLPADSPAPGAWDDWKLGDYLLGYGNSHDDPPLQGRFWTDSTFLVVRKLRQDVDALQAMVGGPPAQSKLAALMVGRRQDGSNLINGTPGNAFDYAGDPAGAQCPLHSHVRRANPRVRKGQREDLRVLPRILRRGMSYGPPHTPQTAQEERGVVFMAYNASIAEQFELIQSWLSGGNSGGDGSYSGQRDPIFARPRQGDRDSFVFGPHPQPGPLPLRAEAARPVALQWGLYLFVPSVPALEDIARFATETGCPAPASDPAAAQRAAEAKKGAMVIAKLKAAESALGLAAAREQWKLALEDLGARQNGTSQWLWTAVRELHGGVLRTPYGVLVGSRDRVMEVFGDDRSFSATGYCPRMASSFGAIYLGMDQGPDYRAQSTVPNEAIMAVTRQQAFDAALADTQAVLGGWRSGAGPAGFSFDVKDLVDAVLARVCTAFFGLPEAGGTMRTGGWQARSGQANADQPSCPGHFGAPSRYMFQPNPGEEAIQQGQDHGRALKDYVEARLHAGGPDLQSSNASIIGARLRGIDKAQYASTLIGIMMGFLPTVDGTLRSALYEWVNDRSLWDLQLAWAAHRGQPPSAALDVATEVIEPVLRRTMQLRPVPELVWRTATTRRTLGGVEVAPGERIVVGIVSAMQQNLQEGSPDLWPVFGGRRAGEQHPTHACPGHEMAMGVMLGVLAGLLGAELRPSLSPTMLRLMP